MSDIEVGSRVQYASRWLRSTGQIAGWAPHARGTVVDVEPFGRATLATVRWDESRKYGAEGDEQTFRVLASNLEACR